MSSKAMTDIEGLKVECPRQGASPFNLVNGSYLTANMKPRPDFYISFIDDEYYERTVKLDDIRNTREANIWAKGYFEGTGVTHWTVYEKLA